MILVCVSSWRVRTRKMDEGDAPWCFAPESLAMGIGEEVCRGPRQPHAGRPAGRLSGLSHGGTRRAPPQARRPFSWPGETPNPPSGTLPENPEFFVTTRF